MIGIVVVSHSAALAQGVVELAGQMAPDVRVAAAGGTDEGEIGTSLDLVTAALAEADSGDGAVVLTDLGSATMTAELALEMLDERQRDRVLLVDGPLVEGAIAAATAAQGGAALDEVAGAARGDAPAEPGGAFDVTREVVLRNRLGLHARPASAVVRALAGLDARVRVGRTDSGAGADGRSVLGMVALAAAGGTALRLEAAGADAARALDAIERLVADGFGEDDAPPEPAAAQAGPGLAAAPGVAVGPAARLRPAEVAIPDSAPRGADEERADLAAARGTAATALESEGGTGIFAAQLDLLADPELDAAVQEGLRAGRNAAQAWSAAVEAQRARLAALDDPLFAARAADVADVGRRVLVALLGVAEEPASVPRGAVAVADDLVPSQVPALAESGAVAIALAVGAPGSHAAVLARGVGLPLVVGLGRAITDVVDGTLLLVDGDSGTVRVDPPDALVREVRRATERARESGEAARAAAREPVLTRDGVALRVGANVASRAEAEQAVAQGADEFGLLRTELAFLGRPTLPDEDEQAEGLAAILAAAGGRPVVVRTLDVGGDKVAPALGLDPARNGFLGQRGLRWSLAHPDVFAVQLRAILRAADGQRVRLMFPMVTTVAEVRAARRALDQARRALDARGVQRGDVEQVGIMVEVPAAAVAADSLAGEVDFFSIGSNDLLSYLMAADRTLGEVAGLRDPRHPAFFSLVRTVCSAAERAGIWVGVCGDTAGDPELAVALARLGVTELSMAPPAIPAVKARLRATDLGAAGPG